MRHKPYEIRDRTGLVVSRHASQRYAMKAKRAFIRYHGYEPSVYFIAGRTHAYA